MGSSNAVCATGIGWHKKKTTTKQNTSARIDHDEPRFSLSPNRTTPSVGKAQRKTMPTGRLLSRDFIFIFFYFLFDKLLCREELRPTFFATALFTIYPFFFLSLFTVIICKLKRRASGKKANPPSCCSTATAFFFFGKNPIQHCILIRHADGFETM